MNLRELIEIKEHIENSKNEMMKLEGRKEEYSKILDEELKKYNITQEEIEEFLKNLKTKIEKIENEIEEEIEELEELL